MINIKTYTMTIAMIIGFTMVVTACSDDDENSKEEPKSLVTETQAGTFTLKNLTYNGLHDGSSITALPGDTIMIAFTPKQGYESIPFEIECKGLDKTDSNLYRVPDKATNGDIIVELTAEFKDETKTTIFSYSAQMTFIVKIPEAYVVIPYTITMSPDLQELVIPEVSYTDTYGTAHTFTVSDNDIVKPDSVLLEIYADADGNKHLVDVTKNEPQEGWEKVGERKVATPTSFTFNVRYYQVGVKSNVTVNYIPKQHSTLTRDRYYLSHQLTRGSATVRVPNLIYIDHIMNMNIAINIGGDSGISRDEVDAAISELAKQPDVLNLYIDPQNTGLNVIN